MKLNRLIQFVTIQENKMLDFDTILCFCCFLLLAGAGCGGNQDHNSNGMTASDCVESGGDWIYINECPSACAPPPPTLDDCETITEMMCASVCSEEPNCHCPADKPFWLDGCVGFEECPTASLDED